MAAPSKSRPMENCSIRNSSPAIGPISMPSSAQLRRSNSASAGFFGTLGLTIAVESWTLRLFNTQHSTLNAQRSIQTVECWMLGVGRWTFALFRRVTGAWWPSRSSKPLSVRKSRGRFDSCPLRQSSTVAAAVSAASTGRHACSTDQSKGGEQVCRASKFASSLRFRPALGERPS